MRKNIKNKKIKEQNPADIRKKRDAKNILRTAMLGTAFGLCASAIVGLSVALYYAQNTITTHEQYQRQMDAVYSRAYYDLLDGASDLGVTLRKIGVSNSQEMQQSLLFDVWSVAQLAEGNLGVFEGKDEGILQAQKFVNQLGDFSHSLALRLADGKAISTEERKMLLEFGEMADVYKSALEGVWQDVESGKAFTGEGGALEGFDSAFADFVEPSFEYPTMIYDGPFSASLENREAKGLLGEDISERDGEQLIKQYFSEHDLSDVQCVGEGHGNIPTVNYSLTIDGDNAFVQLSKKGGMIISYNSAIDFDIESSVSVEASQTCQQSALEFAKKIGLKDMQVVWSTSEGGECIVNLAPVVDNVIIYPDLVKIKLVESESRVVGADITHYAYNHTQRDIPSPVISLSEAESKISLNIVAPPRLALIPLHETKEVLTYEFECEDDNNIYYVYINALTGNEENILCVIDDEVF